MDIISKIILTTSKFYLELEGCSTWSLLKTWKAAGWCSLKGAWMGNVLFQEWSARKKSDGMYLSGEEEADKFNYSAIYRYYM